MTRWTFLGVVAMTSACASSGAKVPVLAHLGQAAPSFTLTDLDGTSHSLSDYAGKVTVLEWFNPGCPYVQYSHREGPLREQAARAQGEGVAWLAINSGSPGKQGHGLDTNRSAAAAWSMGHPVLIDEGGSIGRAYGAKTTPHMYVIDAAGALVYQGAIDNAPFGKAPGAVSNFVDLALASVKTGTPVQTADTKPYGCSVKY